MGTMGSSLRWVRARRLALAGSAVAGALALAAGAAPAGASVGKATVAAKYNCTFTVLGSKHSYAGSINVTGTTPAKVAPKASVYMTGWKVSVIIPATIVNQIRSFGVTSISGVLTTFDIKSTDLASTVNAAAGGIKFGPLALKANTPLAINLPSATGKTVGHWVAGTTGTMTFATGPTGITISALGQKVPVTCAPGPSVIISKSVV
jgi:hypothetical protein